MTVTAFLRSNLQTHRTLFIAGAVLAFHVLAIWALQTGLLMRAVETIVPVEVLAQMIEPSKPVMPIEPKETLPPPPVPVKQPLTPKTPTAPIPPTPAQPAPQILAAVETTPTPNAPAPQQMAPPNVPVAVAPSAAPTPVAAAKVQLPSSNAEYLNNPKPPYPLMSKRMGEQGSVLVRIFIGADGLPQKAELQRSSGFERLDQAALAVVMQWRYVPGNRGGVPEAMWMGATIRYVLE